MIYYDTVELLSEPLARGVYETADPVRREVYCAIRSVWANEAYAAMAHGFTPDMTVVLSNPEDYQKERRLVYDGDEYDIIRVYLNKAEGLELTCQRRIEDEPRSDPDEP